MLVAAALSIVFLPAAVLAAPAPATLGLSFSTAADKMPTLTLPYATYKASFHDTSDDYYTFKNIRFAAPPVGNLRWAKPAAPLTETEVQDGSVGNQCHQATSGALSFGYPILSALEPVSEDCLFLDIIVPGKAVRGEAKDLPVLFWIFGGGYVLGSKSFFLYDGSPFLKSARNNLIYVAPNYRLGAFGFLSGPTVEKDATPNAALWDQRAALKWVQDYIGLVGGDKGAVTAMGESAGAGSIMYHLVGNSGTLDPMFQRAIMMSPAFEPMYDRTKLEATYKQFEAASGCAGKGITCLRSKTSKELQKGNLNVTFNAQYGTFGFGPAVDNQFINDLPGVEMANGNYWKDVSVITSHTASEGSIFADPSKNSNSEVSALLKSNFPAATAKTLKHLDSLYGGGWPLNFARLSTLIGEWVVSCNSRFIAKAYAGKAWMYQFSVPPGTHAVDLLFAFWRTDLNIGPLQIDLDISFITQKNYATGFQSYLTSFVRSGNPNTYRETGGIPATIAFPAATVGNQVQVLNLGLLGYSSRQDGDTPKDRCDFWESGAWTGR